MKDLSNFEFTKSGRGRSKYDWDLLFNGEVHEVEAGKDFEVDAKSFVGQVGTKATKVRKQVRKQILPNGNVVVQAVGDLPPTTPKASEPAAQPEAATPAAPAAPAAPSAPAAPAPARPTAGATAGK